MIDRRRALGLLSGTALSTALAAPMLGGRSSFASTRDNERERRDGRDSPDNPLIYNLPLRTRARLLLITQVYLMSATQLFLMGTNAGVEQFNENRLSLSAIPILGQLSRRRYQEDEFSPSNEIGAVYADGTALFIYLFPEVMLDPIARTFIFLNLAYSFALRNKLDTSTWLAMAAAMPKFCAIGAVSRVVPGRIKQLPAPGAVGVAPDMDRLAVAGKLSDETQGQSQIPAIRDIPLLRDMFVGSIHTMPDNKLVTVVRPSIIFGDRDT